MRYLYYTIQTLRRGRSSTFIKLVSLTLGLLVGVLLFAQIAYELNYERCYPEADRLVLARETFTEPNGVPRTTSSGHVFYDPTLFDVTAHTLEAEMPEWVESATVIGDYGNQYVYKGDKLLEHANYIEADTSFFHTMGIEVLKGLPQEMIQGDAIFLSQGFAKEVFGDENPMGRELLLDKKERLTVRGIYRDMPDNTFLGHYDFVRSIHADGGYRNGFGWKGNDMFYSILRLRRAEDIDAVNAHIQRVMEKYTPLELEGRKFHFSVISLPDCHTDDPDTRRHLAILGFLGFAIFFVAAMNYILISIATLSRRAKTVGVHKCNGAGEGQIFTMFLLETGVMVVGAAVLSALLLAMFAPVVEEQLGTPLASLFTGQTLWVPLLTMLLLFLVAGVLPGRMFARIPVTQVFRRYTDGKKGWKRGLLAVQFAGVSFVLGLLLVTAMQYTMLIHADMGFRIPGLVQAENWMDGEQGESVCDYIRRQPYVEGVTTAANGILWDYWTQGLIDNSGKRIATLNYNPCGKDYVQVTGIQMLEGHAPERLGEVIVNEEVVRLMGWTDGAIGKRLNNFRPGRQEDYPIVGVFRDVRNSGFANGQNPIALAYATVYHAFNVRLKEPYDDNLNQLNAFMKETFPDVGLHFISVDELHRNMYWNVSRFRNSVMLTSLFIVLIALMGLIGYVNDETGRRSKEIAIRKVNGATAGSILALLSRGILYVAVPCVAVGTAVAWYVGTEWLAQFAEEVSLHPWHFVLLALGLLVLVVCIVVLKAWRIAGENPVESLKTE